MYVCICIYILITIPSFARRKIQDVLTSLGSSAFFSRANAPRVRHGRVLAVPHPDAAERGARGVQ